MTDRWSTKQAVCIKQNIVHTLNGVFTIRLFRTYDIKIASPQKPGRVPCMINLAPKNKPPRWTPIGRFTIEEYFKVL